MEEQDVCAWPICLSSGMRCLITVETKSDMQSYTAFVRDGLMHVSKVDLSAVSLPHTFPTGLIIETEFSSCPEEVAVWCSLTCVYCCWAFLSNPAHMEQPSDNCSTSQQPERDYNCSCRWYTWLLTELAPSTHTHSPHSVIRLSCQAADRPDQSHSCALPSLAVHVEWPWVYFLLV